VSGRVQLEPDDFAVALFMLKTPSGRHGGEQPEPETSGLVTGLRFRVQRLRAVVFDLDADALTVPVQPQAEPGAGIAFVTNSDVSSIAVSASPSSPCSLSSDLTACLAARTLFG
jgi:hypothetical protein